MGVRVWEAWRLESTSDSVEVTFTYKIVSKRAEFVMDYMVI